MGSLFSLLSTICSANSGYIHINLLNMGEKGNPSWGKKWGRWNGQVCWEDCELNLGKRKHTTTSQPLTRSLSLPYLSFCQCPPPPPFLSFPWNPFPIIKDTQMKSTLRKSGFQQWGGGIGGGGRGGWEAESWKWGIGSSRSTPSLLLPLFHPLPQWEPMLEKGRVALARYGSISSTLLISKSHYFVLCLAEGQDSSRALYRLTAVSFPASSLPHPR